MHIALLSLVVVLATSVPQAQSLWCYYSQSFQQKYMTNCGFQGWDRCSRYRVAYEARSRCCSGWLGSSCSTPTCSSYCSGGCTSPNNCNNCYRGYYAPRCYRCASIANCEDVYCSSSTNQRCGSCSGDYGTLGAAYRPSQDNRRCIKQCSWRSDSNACYPGSCTNGLCTCSSGFSGQDCRTMESPVILEYEAFLIKDDLTLEAPDSENGNGTIYTDKSNFTHIRVNWKVSYELTDLPTCPPYIESIDLGLVSTSASVYVNIAEGGLFQIGQYDCQPLLSADNPQTGLFECKFEKNISYGTWTPSTGDVMQYSVEASSGGRMRLYNRDQSSRIMTRYYIGASDSASLSFTFALTGASHCVNDIHCITTMLDAGKNVISEPVVSVTWEGWTDIHAGINEYNLEVRQLSGTVGDEMNEMLDTPAVYQGASESGLNITLPHAGVYSFVLSVVDNVDNVRRSRRFVFFDNDPDDVTIQTDFPMRVQVSDGWQSQGAWLSLQDGVSGVRFDWQDHFANSIHHSQGLLKPIGQYAKGIIDAEYDQNFGERGRAAVPNALGVAEFRVFSDVDHSGGQTIVNSSSNPSDWSHVGVDTQTLHSPPPVVDGDSIRFWVEARDIAGHFVRDSILLHVDSSPPVIEDTRIAVTQFALSVHFRAFDEHSGIKAVTWWLFDNETDSVVESGQVVVVPLNLTENATDYNPSACMCTPLGDCYATAMSFKPTLPAGFEEGDFFIKFSVLNNAGLTQNDTIKPTLTEDNAVSFTDALVKDSNDTSSIDDFAVFSTADILDSIVNLQYTSPEVTENVLTIVSNLLQVNDSQLGQDDAVAKSSSRIVKSLGRQISNVVASGGNVSYTAKNLAVRAMPFHSWDLADGLGFAAVVGETPGDVLTDDQVDVYGSDDDVPVEQVVASVELPAQITDRFQGADSIPVSFVMYQRSTLFRSQLTNATATPGVGKFIDSRVIAAAVEGAPITDLPDDAPVITAFHQENMMKSQDPELQTTECVFWDFSLREGIGEWSTEGCRRRTSVAGRTVCHCNHTTNFAVLVSIRSPVFNFALDGFSKFGCSITVIALVITIFVYTAIRSLRSLEASRILVSFCCSLLLLYLVFLAGIERTSSRAGCITAAIFIHYFALTSMAWMGVEAVNLYLKLVKVCADMRRFMIKASLVAWGIPMVVIVFILIVDHTQYDSQDSCFLKTGPAFYVGELLIIILVFLFNLIVFMLIIRKLTRSKVLDDTEVGKKAMITRRLKSAVSVTTLFVLTWAFGLLAVINVTSVILQVLFCFFNSLQGLLIFLFFVVQQEKVREKVSYLVRSRRGGYKPNCGSRLTSTACKTKLPLVNYESDGAIQVVADPRIYEVTDVPTAEGKEDDIYDAIDGDEPGNMQPKVTPITSGMMKNPLAVLTRLRKKASPQMEASNDPSIYENTDTPTSEGKEDIYDALEDDKPGNMQPKVTPFAIGKMKNPLAVLTRLRKKATPQEVSKESSTPDDKTEKPVATEQREVSQGYESTVLSNEDITVSENDYMDLNVDVKG